MIVMIAVTLGDLWPGPGGAPRTCERDRAAGALEADADEDKSELSHHILGF